MPYIKKTNTVQRFRALRPRVFAVADALTRKGFATHGERMAVCQRRLDTDIIDENGLVREVVSAAFRCRHPICPVCSVFRSLRSVALIAPIIQQVLEDNPDAVWAFWSVTSGAGYIAPENGPAEVSRIAGAWRQTLRVKPFKDSVLGVVKCLDVTRNATIPAVHPHWHNLMLLQPGYGPRSKHWVHADVLREIFSKKMSKPVSQVHMRTIGAGSQHYDAIFKSVVECLYYSFKAQDLGLERLPNGKWSADPDAVYDIWQTIRGRNKYTLSGEFYQARKKLRLAEAAEDAPLDEHTANVVTEYLAQRRYLWDTALGRYVIEEF